MWLAVGRLRRRGTGSRVPAVGLLLVGLGLVAVAIVPDLVRPIQDLLGLSGEPLGRLVTVLVVSVAIAYCCCSTRWPGPIVPTSGSAGWCGRCRRRRSRRREAGAAGAASSSASRRSMRRRACPRVLAEIPAEVAGLQTHVLVIDDGSRDGTAAVATGLGARVVSHPVNSGQGAALQTGYLVAERLGVDVVVTLDADGQHDPAQMDRLVEPIVRGEADFVVGSRRMGESRGRRRVAGARRRGSRSTRG